MEDENPEIDPYTKEKRESVGDGVGVLLLYALLIWYFLLELIVS